MREEKRKSEAQHQSAVMKWSQQPSIRQRWPCLCLLHHIPNGGRRDPIEARHLKEQGVKPGVPDLCLPVPRGRFHGLYIELKTQRGHATPEQEWWGRKLQEQGYAWFVCRGWQSAIAAIEEYLRQEVGG